MHVNIKNDGIVKSRHSRENGNPENSNYMKILDSCLRRNDRQWPFQTFYDSIKNRFVKIIFFYTRGIYYRGLGYEIVNFHLKYGM